jgi:hypothetical protein
MHFHLLSTFYEKVKRCVATGRGQRIDIDNYTHAERSAAVQFGTLLHRHGMLKDFYYHRSPKKQLRVIPTKDGQIGQFLTGGWLEIYVSAVLTKRLRAAMSPAKFQLLYNVKGVLEDGREFEADLMAAVEGRLFWLECKTGQWQDYSARFRGLVKIFGVDRESAALLLIRPPDSSTRARATDMLDMTLLSLDEVDDFISVFLGEEPASKKRLSEDSRDAEDFGTVPPLSDDEIPLENAEPAKKLGSVNLGGDGDGDGASTSESPRRRRRRRRGGRGRGRGGAAEKTGSEEDSKSEGESRRQPEARKGKLLEPVPMERLEDEPAEAVKEDTPRAEKGTEASSEKPQRRRRRRRASPFAAEEGKVAEEKPAEEEVEAAVTEVVETPAEETPGPEIEAAAETQEEEVAEAAPEQEVEAEQEEPVVQAEAEAEPEEPEVEAEPEPEPEPVGEVVKSASGVTIAPDLAAMMAGSKKPSEKQD